MTLEIWRMRRTTLRGFDYAWLSPFIAILSLAIALHSPVAIASAPEAVSPDQCVVTPLSVSELTEIATAFSVATPVSMGSLDGEPADDETVLDITEVIRQSVACANANDPLRAYALFSTSYLQERFGGRNLDDLGHLVAALSREPAVAAAMDQLALISISDVRLLLDGSVAAIVETENARDRFVDEVVLVQDGDRWLIDRVILGSSVAEDTPVP